MKLLLACALLSLSAMGQEAVWDNSPHGADLAAQAARLKPLLDQLKPEEWVAQGAPQPTSRSSAARSRSSQA